MLPPRRFAMPLKKIFLFAAIFFPSILSARPGHGQEKFPESWEIDATLRSVFFLDHDLGWAVGDKGTLLKTEDGGREWQSISSPRDIIWTSVFFADDSTGWIAGGHYRGPLERSVGLLIKTEDGGKTRSNLSPPGVSLIRRIRFADPSHGWIACDSNQLYPDGLLKTEDGGASWTSARASGEPPLLLDWDEAGQLHTLSIDSAKTLQA